MRFNNPTQQKMKIKNMTTRHLKKSIGRSLSWRCGFVLVPLALLCFGLLPTAKALLPAPSPDGNYPGGNTAEGINALHDVNTAVGINNTAVGANALTNDTTGAYNVAVGSGALQSNTTGFQNMAIGAEALANNHVGNFNMAIGFRALNMNTGGRNSAVGAAALRNNAGASDNTAIGSNAMRENTIGENNTAIGADALSSNINGTDNNAVGNSALANNTTGNFNEALGSFALGSNVEGGENVAIGDSALNNADSSFNTVVGYSSGQNLTTGSENIYIGDTAGTLDILGASPGDEAGVIRIGSVFSGTAACFINGIATNSQVWNGVTVCQVTVNGSGQLGVDCVNPNNPGATPASPQRQVMLNDKVEKLQATVAQQQKQIETLTAKLEEQAAQIQKVSAQLAAASPSFGGLEVNKFATGRIRSGGRASQLALNKQ